MRYFFFVILFLLPVVSQAETFSSSMARCQLSVTANSGGSCIDQGPVSETQGLIRFVYQGLYYGYYYYELANQCEGNEGNSVRLTGESGGIPSSVCHSGCTYNSSGVGVSFPSSGAWLSSFTGTETPCSIDDGLDSGDDNCVTGPSGNKACYEPANQNCGSFNGQSVCVDDVAANNCISDSSGSVLCESGSTGGPDNGTPGVPATPDDSFQLGDVAAGGGVEIDYYAPGTVSDATNSDDFPPSDSSDDDLPAACDPATDPNGCRSAAECGTSDTPPCAVVVDESGTPVGTDDMFAGDVGQSLIDSIGDAPGIASPVFVPDLPVSQSCQTITISWRGATRSIPSVLMCSRVETFKTVLSWFFYLSTAFFLFRLATRSPT